MDSPFAHRSGCFGGQHSISLGPRSHAGRGEWIENEREEKLSQNEVMYYVPEVLEGALIREML